MERGPTPLAVCIAVLLTVASPVKAQIVLTITGDIEAPNRGPRDDFRDSMFKYLNIEFSRARAITLEELKALPQRRLEVSYDNWPRREEGGYACEGPSLAAVVALAEPAGNQFLTRALDGFAWPYDPATTDLEAVVVAHTFDGEPLAIGGRGPLMLCMTPGTYPGQTRAEDSGLTWALFHIEVR
ncbi:MAG: hypothetical protein ACFCBW_13410 [Candidatus Competibacterales bacterium]